MQRIMDQRSGGQAKSTPLEREWRKMPQLGAAMVLLGGMGQACADKYPIRPTFCDDFCRATLRPGCDSEPEDCVRECELQDIAPDCEPAQQELLSCYQNAPDDAFVCWGRGSSVRVRDGVCAAQRDALLVCELPTIEPCLQFCRPYQRLLDQRVQSEMGTADASVSEQCALLRQSCDGICWNLLTIGAPEVNDSFGRGDLPPGLEGIPETRDAGSNQSLAAVGSLLPGCGF